MEDIFYEMSLEDDYKDRLGEKAFDDALEEALSDAMHDAVGMRIKNFYLHDNELLLPAYLALKNAKAHLEFSPTSTIIYTGIAQEILLKQALLKPLVFGIVNNEIASEIICNYLFDNNKSPFEFNKMNNVISLFTEIDFQKHIRYNSKTVLWVEMSNLKKKRNDAVHKGKQYFEKDAQEAITLVTYLYNLLIEQVLKSFCLQTNEGIIQKIATK